MYALTSRRPVLYDPASAPPTFTAIALSPDDTRTLIVLNPDRHLGKVETLRVADLQNNSLTIHLAPLAVVTGRLLDRTTSKPLPDLPLMPAVGSKYLPLVTTDAAGKLALSIPTGDEASISVFAGPYTGDAVAKNLVIEPGETHDLGDIRLRAARRR